MMKNYDPQSISDIVFGNSIAEELIKDIVSGDQRFPFAGKNGLLLYGAYGTGKTTLANMLPNAIEQLHNGNNALIDFQSIQAGSSGAEVIKMIKRRMWTVPFGAYTYYVLDEVDQFDKGYMSSLKTVMDSQFSVFVMTTNNLGDVDMGVQSRSHRIELNAAPSNKWLPTFKQVLLDQNAHCPPDAEMLKLIKQCNGCARDIINAADRLACKQRKTAKLGINLTGSTAMPASALPQMQPDAP